MSVYRTIGPLVFNLLPFLKHKILKLGTYTQNLLFILFSFFFAVHYFLLHFAAILYLYIYISIFEMSDKRSNWMIHECFLVTLVLGNLQGIVKQLKRIRAVSVERKEHNYES